VNTIANRMREIDARECLATGRTPKQALRAGLARSIRAWTALVDDRPEAMFGVVVESLLGREGLVWFLGTDEVYRHGRELLMWGPGFISRLHDSSLVLRNIVSSENRRAIRLLERWGFKVSADEQEIGGMKFRQFVKEPS
jgi:hypothetical protein